MERKQSNLRVPEECCSLREFGIEDDEFSARSQDEAEPGGEVAAWENLEEQLKRQEHFERLQERSEKRKWRCRITIAVVSVWVTWILIGLVRLVLVGDSLLLTSSAAMSIPFVMIVRFYFMDQ
jgi:hypothetical protein